MHISIIIPVHNGGNKFRKCLASVYNCLDAESELIVVADGETDGAWRAALDCDAKLVMLPQTQGAAKARNAGACKAMGELLFLSMPMSSSRKMLLRKIRSIFTDLPDLSALIGSYDADPFEPNFLSQYKNLLHHYVHQQGSEEASTFWGACGVVRRSAFWAVNGFGNNYRGATIEDIDLGYRLKQEGFRIRLVKSLQVKHLKHWRARSLLRTDIFARALPWTRLILQGHGLVNDLNLKTRDRVSLILAYVLLFSVFGSFFISWLSLSGGAAAGLFVVFNFNLYRFFWYKRGLSFCLQAILWHWFYFLYSGLGFGIGLIEVMYAKIRSFTHSKQKRNQTLPDRTDSSDYIRQTTFGTLADVLAGSLSLPTGIITAGFLTRSLGPEDYGLLSTVVVMIVWVEISISVGFNRSLIHFVAEKAEWPKLGSVLQVQLLVSLIAAGLLAAFSGLLARALHSSELSTYLCLFCLDIPLFTLGVNHKSILVAQGRYLQRALLTAVFWLSRMALIVLFVTLEPTVSFAILAFIGASLIVLILARLMVRPPLFPIRIIYFNSLWHFAWPLFLFTVGITTFRNIDLVLVKAFDPSGQSTGFYAAAKNLTLILGLYTASFSPLLQSKLAELAAAGRKQAAQALLGNSIRLTVCMLPLAGLASGSAVEVVRLIYGSDFSRAAPLLAVLMFGAVFLSILSVAVAALIAAKRPNLPLLLTGPVILSAPVLYALAISRFGPLGAAWLATGLAFVALVPALGACLRLWGIVWPASTLAKSTFICVLAYWMATFWATPGCLVLLKLAVGSSTVLLLYYSFGELNRYELARFFSALFPGGRVP